MAPQPHAPARGAWLVFKKTGLFFDGAAAAFGKLLALESAGIADGVGDHVQDAFDARDHALRLCFGLWLRPLLRRGHLRLTAGFAFQPDWPLVLCGPDLF